MSALDTLIKVKKSATTDDLLRFLDELILYEKLAKAETFRDLKTSAVAQKKLPLLSGIYTGDIYSLAICEIVCNIISHLDETIPEIIQEPVVDLSPKELRRLEILRKSVITSVYYSLNEYNHDIMKDHVVAVFTGDKGKQKQQAAILIVVKDQNMYQIFQGFYTMDKETDSDSYRIEPYIYRDHDMILSITTYSMQGNNAYAFGELTTGSGQYSVMMPTCDTLWLLKQDENEKIVIKLTMEEINALNLAKLEIETFSKCIMDIIRKGQKYETIDADTGSGIRTD